MPSSPPNWVRRARVLEGEAQGTPQKKGKIRPKIEAWPKRQLNLHEQIKLIVIVTSMCVSSNTTKHSLSYDTIYPQIASDPIG